MEITYERMGSHILWTVPDAKRNSRSNSEIMMDHGYHPAGYGSPFDIYQYEGYSTFKCWSSCD